MLKKFLKLGALFILALLLFYLGGEAGYQAKYYSELWKNSRANEKLNEQILQMFKNDTYGGKTPEETYNLFVSALKNEDIDLAVKYIVLDEERRQRYYKDFDDLKQQGKLIDYVNDWPEWNNWKQVRDKDNDWESRAEIWYSKTIDKPMVIYDSYIKQEREVPAGEYTQQDIIFTKTSNNIWKIETM